MDKQEFVKQFLGDWSCDTQCKLDRPKEQCHHTFIFGSVYGWVGTCNPCYMVGHFVDKERDECPKLLV